MIISHRFGVLKKDGTAQLYVRLIGRDKNGRRIEQRIKVPGVVLPPSQFNDRLWRVKAAYPLAEDYNQTLDKFRDKLKHVAVKYQQGSIDYEMAVRLASSGNAIDSVLDYIDTKFALDKNSVHLSKVRKTVITITNKLQLDSLLFKDINEDNLLRVKAIMIHDENRSPHSFNSYMRDLRTVWNHARERDYVLGNSPFRKSLFAKAPPLEEVKTARYEDILKAIHDLKSRGEDRRSLKSAVNNFEVIAFWLLMFAMRGLYQEDLHSITAYNLDFDFDRKVDAINKGYWDEKLPGNMMLLKHRRHKTKYPMNIFIGIPPILPLIRFLRLSLAFTHPKLCFNNASELGTARVDMNGFIRSVPKTRIDPLRLFKITKETDELSYTNFWRAMRKRANKMHLPPFKTARATFMTIADSLGISISDSKLLIGHADTMTSKHYRNVYQSKLVRRLASSHLEILEEFRVAELYEELLDKAKKELGEFGQYLNDNCQIGVYTPYFMPDLKQFLSENDNIPDEKQLHLIKSGKYYPDTSLDEFVRNDVESMNENERESVLELYRPLSDKDVESYFS